MHYRRLGHSGLKVSEISLGSWITFGSQVDEKAASDLINSAYEQGVNFFDNADMYANGQAETIMGKAIRGLPREALILSSKVFWPTMPGPNGRGLSRKHITESIDASLKRFGVEYIDLYFCHRFDPDTPLEETARVMDDLVHRGKILYWGTSEWEAYQISQLFGVCRELNLVPPTMEQPRYHLFHRRRVEDEIFPVSHDLGLGLISFSPLYYGILTGKYNEGIPAGSRATLEGQAWINQYITPERIDVVRRLTDLAGELGLTTAQLSIAWILRRKEVSSVITGASRLEQLDENLAAAEAVEKLTNDVLEEIDAILENSPVE